MVTGRTSASGVTCSVELVLENPAANGTRRTRPETSWPQNARRISPLFFGCKNWQKSPQKKKGATRTNWNDFGHSISGYAPENSSDLKKNLGRFEFFEKSSFRISTQGSHHTMSRRPSYGREKRGIDVSKPNVPAPATGGKDKKRVALGNMTNMNVPVSRIARLVIASQPGFFFVCLPFFFSSANPFFSKCDVFQLSLLLLLRNSGIISVIASAFGG